MRPFEAATIAGVVAREVPALVRGRCEDAALRSLPGCYLPGPAVQRQVYLSTAPATEWTQGQVARAARLPVLRAEYPGEYAR